MNDVVLIVDDSLTVRMDLVEALETAGFRAVPCATATEAKAILEREQPALVILDVLLPDADGVDLLRQIRESANALLPVMLLSTEDEVSDRVRGLQTGADEYVCKPYDTRYVVSRAHELVRKRLGAGGPSRPRVLVIDDSQTYAKALGAALEMEGYGVIDAPTGEEGLRLAADVRPAAIVVDNVLPGIDGATVVRRIRLDAALRGIPCLLLTASDDEGAELRALDSGADAFVRKTEDLVVILARFKAMFRRAAASSEAPATASLSGPRRILAVDDSETYLRGLADVLRGEGYDVVLAWSGAEALEMLRFQQVDCILLDVLMPGLSGNETCQRIKADPALRDMPVILLTALEDRQSMIAGFSTGADDYIAKSGDFAVLEARVRAQIRRKQFEDETRRIREELLRMEIETGEARAAKMLAEAHAAHAEELERKNRELEAFSYSVSHDLRAPLRAIDGFSHAVLHDFADDLDPQAAENLHRVRRAAQRMGELIEDLLGLARISQSDLARSRVNLSALAQDVGDELRSKHAERAVDIAVEQGVETEADGRLVRIMLENLIGNAWKFTAKSPLARIVFGARREGGEEVFFVQDTGAGFDPARAQKLFQPFRRLHADAEYPGTGIGLATVHRIVDRHGGRVWAESGIGKGATFFFTLHGGEDGRHA
jgi:two-component system NtrC family sensor kinase